MSDRELSLPLCKHITNRFFHEDISPHVYLLVGWGPLASERLR